MPAPDQTVALGAPPCQPRCNLGTMPSRALVLGYCPRCGYALDATASARVLRARQVIYSEQEAPDARP
jgi:hypothetical protein